MQNTYKKRICIITHGLGGGGLERVAAMQSVYLHEVGYVMYVASVTNNVGYEFKGELLNLASYKNGSNSILNRIKRFIVLKKFIKKNQIDLIIDHRPRTRWFSEWLISTLLYNIPTIYVVHNSKISNYFPTKNRFLNKPYRRSKKIVGVSKFIEEKIKKDYGFQNVQTIYNPVAFNDDVNTSKEKNKFNYKFVLWYGRLDDSHKNIKLLLDAYSISQLPLNNIRLLIAGKGQDESQLKRYAKTKGIKENILFLGHITKPSKYIKKAHFVVLTSRYEGFPMVLPESLSCGTPVISVDCECGPSEIIKNRVNGILVENHNEKKLSEAMNELITDSELYQKCRSNAKESIEHLRISKIRDQWINLIENE